MTGTLVDRHILILEDEYFIASDLKRALEACGAKVRGPVGDLSAGLALAECEPLDAAILDVNLEGAYSYAIADRLVARGVPFAFLTGYDEWALPANYRAIPRLAKPFILRSVIELAERLCVDTSVA